MKSTLTTIALIALLVLTLACGASAQYSSSERNVFGVGVSTVKPAGDELRQLSSMWYGPSLYWNTAFDEFDRPNISVSVAWLGAEERDTKAEFLPIRATYIKRYGSDESSCWYLGGGLDLYFAKYSNIQPVLDLTTLNTSYKRVNDSGPLFGVNAVAGRELGGGWFFELRNDLVSKLSHETGGNVDFSGWSVSFGTRAAY